MNIRFEEYRFPHTVRFFLVFFLVSACSGCAIRSLSPNYQGPAPRSAELLKYYDNELSYSSFRELIVEESASVTTKHIVLETSKSTISIDYFAHRKNHDDLILVFPMLGGRNELALHFSEYLSRFGIDAAIVHRKNDFKEPENFERFEEICRQDAINTRTVIDFFQQEYGKKDFGSFGVSRGAISAAIAAGIDDRLRYNVFALGGSDIVGLFRDSDERKIRRYVEKASASQGISEEEFYESFEDQIRTDPKYLAQYIDARNTLLILGLFDSTVPIKYGRQLRSDLGDPETIYLVSGHRTSGLFTQYVSLVPPAFPPGNGLFPFDYLESETLDFFRRSFKRGRFDFKLMLMRVLQAPVNLIVDLFNDE